MLDTRVLPLIEVAGSHREIGRQFGEQARESIHEYSEMWLAKASKKSGLSRDELLRKIDGFIQVIDAYAPQLADEVRGVAEGAGLSEREAFAIQVRMELLFAGPPPPSCTTFALTGSRTASGNTVVGQNVDLDAEVDRFGLMIKIKPENKPAVLMYTSPGLVSYVGLNDAGLAVHGNLLTAPGWRSGFPRYMITRLMLEQTTVEDALQAGLRPPRASSRNLILGDTHGSIANAELTVEDAVVMRSETGALTHTNHYISAELCDLSQSYIPDSSVHRYERINELMAELDRPVTIDDLQRIFRDHDGFPGSICAHERAGSTTKTVVSLISEPGEGRVYVAAGNPCQSNYETFRF